MSPPLVLALACAVVIGLCWRYRKAPRLIAWFAGPLGFFLAFGLPPLLYAAAGQANSDNGMTALLAVDAIAAVGFLFEALLAHKYHPVITPFICGIFGFTMAVTVADWPQVAHRSAALLPRTGKEIGKAITHIHAAPAAHGQAAHQQEVYLVAFVIGVAVLFLLVRGLHKRREQREGALPVAQPIMAQGLGVGRFASSLWGRRKGKATRGSFGRPQTRPALGGGGPGPGGDPTPAGRR